MAVLATAVSPTPAPAVPTFRTSAPKHRRRVSFSDPNTKLRIYPAEDEQRDKVISWVLVIVSFVVRFYRLGIPASVVFDEVCGSISRLQIFSPATADHVATRARILPVLFV